MMYHPLKFGGRKISSSVDRVESIFQLSWSCKLQTNLLSSVEKFHFVLIWKKTETSMNEGSVTVTFSFFSVFFLSLKSVTTNFTKFYIYHTIMSTVIPILQISDFCHKWPADQPDIHHYTFFQISEKHNYEESLRTILLWQISSMTHNQRFKEL